MNSRDLDKTESFRLQSLQNAGLECALLFLTATGLRKSILDATAPVRTLLHDAQLHNYAQQTQGTAHKVMLQGVFFHAMQAYDIKISAYRPETKKGDPRLWIYELKRFAQEENVLALFAHQQRLHIVNLSEPEQVVFTPESNALEVFLETLRDQYNSVANELLNNLREIAKQGLIEAVCTGDTAVGRTIEAALGIEMNAQKIPDYKGIEIKTKHKGSFTRNGLFAQVPDWNLSHYKSFAEMLVQFGYEKDGNLRLYCTVSSQQPNSQGLLLDVRENEAELHEIYRQANINSPVCIWTLPKLHQCLQTKHRETFWIQVEEIQQHGKRYFQLQKVHHTHKPSNLQFTRLLDTGEITLDHMIKQEKNSVREKGPQFKIKRAALNELFLGEPQDYSLL